MISHDVAYKLLIHILHVQNHFIKNALKTRRECSLVGSCWQVPLKRLVHSRSGGHRLEGVSDGEANSMEDWGQQPLLPVHATLPLSHLFIAKFVASDS